MLLCAGRADARRYWKAMNVNICLFRVNELSFAGGKLCFCRLGIFDSLVVAKNKLET